MKFSVIYRHAGKTYSFDLPGESFDDAQRHLHSAFLNGEIEKNIASIPAPGFIGRFLGQSK